MFSNTQAELFWSGGGGSGGGVPLHRARHPNSPDDQIMIPQNSIKIAKKLNDGKRSRQKPESMTAVATSLPLPAAAAAAAVEAARVIRGGEAEEEEEEEEQGVAAAEYVRINATMDGLKADQMEDGFADRCGNDLNETACTNISLDSLLLQTERENGYVCATLLALARTVDAS